MKALSLGLVKGSIDQLDQEVNMTWVQPRVLDINQVCVWMDRWLIARVIYMSTNCHSRGTVRLFFQCL